MNISVYPSLSARKNADLLVIPFWKGKKHAEAAAEAASLEEHYAGPLKSHDFMGKEGETMLLYVSGAPEKRLILLGLGSFEGVTVEKLRRAFSAITKLCHKKKLKEVNILLPKFSSMSEEDLVRGVVEGILLPNYIFTSLKHDSVKEDPAVALEKVALIGAGKKDKETAEKCLTICESVNFVRDLVNGNADDITPQYLSAVALGLEKTCKGVKTTVFDKKRIEKEKMGLLLAVNRGSFRDPAFIISQYKGNPKSSDHTVLIGKGITFDTGGLNLKPTGSMETMREDMAGAATVLGVVHGAAALELKVNVTAIVATTENSIGSKSYKPGDVYIGYSGKTVEIANTDAEGRLVLADALAYVAKNIKPSRIIDVATLTGAVEVALGSEASGLWSNNDALADLLINAGSETNERLWRLPLYEEYKEGLKSDVADIKSVGGRPGAACRAAIFLQEFVGKVPWAHLDIAGTAFFAEGKRYLPKLASGVGVRLILSLLCNFSKSQ